MKTLIVYYSFTGNNELIAHVLQERLSCDLVRIETVKKRTKFSIFLDFVFHREPAIRSLEVPLGEYDRLVILGPIWAGKIASPVRTFLRTQKHRINRYAFLTVCGGGQSAQKENVKNELTELLNLPPEAMAELWINNIVPPAKRNTIAVSDYRMDDEDVNAFREELDGFVGSLTVSAPEVRAR